MYSLVSAPPTYGRHLWISWVLPDRPGHRVLLRCAVFSCFVNSWTLWTSWAVTDPGGHRTHYALRVYGYYERHSTIGSPLSISSSFRYYVFSVSTLGPLLREPKPEAWFAWLAIIASLVRSGLAATWCSYTDDLPLRKLGVPVLGRLCMLLVRHRVHTGRIYLSMNTWYSS